MIILSFLIITIIIVLLDVVQTKKTISDIKRMVKMEV